MFPQKGLKTQVTLWLVHLKLSPIGFILHISFLDLDSINTE